MTSTSKSAQLRSLKYRGLAANTGGALVKAAKIFGTGSAGVGLQVGTRGYALLRRSAQRRNARRSLAALSPTPSARTTSNVRTRRAVVFGSLVGVAATAAVLIAKRRNTFVPPADAPPSLDDYTDTPVNGSSAHTAQR